MAEPYVGSAVVDGRPGVSWPAIFAGTFVFVAIEVTFGILGTAIFASSNGTWSAGAGVWLIVLSIISMYFGGRAAAHLAGVGRRLNGLYHGLATFGVSVFTAIVVAALVLLTTLGGSAGSMAASRGTVTIISAVSTAGWWLFGALCGAFIAAMIGGSNAAPKSLAPVSQVPTQRAA